MIYTVTGEDHSVLALAQTFKFTLSSA